MKLRLTNITCDGDPPRNEDEANDMLSQGLGWSVGAVRYATNAEIGTCTRKPTHATTNPDVRAWFMVELPAVIEQAIAEAERNNTHYWASIWRMTLGTVWINVEVATTW